MAVLPGERAQRSAELRSQHSGRKSQHQRLDNTPWGCSGHGLEVLAGGRRRRGPADMRQLAHVWLLLCQRLEPSLVPHHVMSVQCIADHAQADSGAHLPFLLKESSSERHEHRMPCSAQVELKD